MKMISRQYMAIVMVVMLSSMFSTSWANADPILTIDSDISSINMASQGLYYIGPESLSIEDIAEKNILFTQKAKNPSGFFGHNRAGRALFAKFEFYNPKSHSIPLLISNRWGPTVYVKSLHITENSRNFDAVHRLQALSERPYYFHQLHLAFDFPSGHSTVYLKIFSQDYLRAHLNLWSPRTFQEYISSDLMLTSSLLSMIALLILLFVFMYITSHEKTFLWPAFFFFFYLIFQTHTTQFHRLLEPLLGSIKYDPSVIIRLTPHLCLFAVCKFTIDFYELKQSSRNFYLLFKGLAWLNIVSWVIILFGSELRISNQLILWGNLITMAPVFICAIWMVYKRYRPAYFNLCGWLLLCLGNALAVGDTLGYFYQLPIPEKGLLLGSVGLGSLLALAIGDRVRLMNIKRVDILKEQQNINASLEAARLVQHQFLTRDQIPGLKIFSYYKPAGFVGGDWYSIHRKDDYALILIGDVTGHGLASALLTGSVAGAIRSYVNDHEVGESPDHYLRHLAETINVVVCQSISTESPIFVTMALLLINNRDGKTFYLNAGHPGIFHIAQTKTSAKISAGSPMGLSDHPVFRVQSFYLAESEKLFIYTDGLVENNQQCDQALSMRKLKRILSSEDHSPQKIATTLRDFVNQNTQTNDDDCTFLLLQRVEPEKAELIDISAA